jgi:hypothetical protein
VLVWMADRRECSLMKSSCTVLRTGETGVRWLRFQSQKGNSELSNELSGGPDAAPWMRSREP